MKLAPLSLVAMVIMSQGISTSAQAAPGSIAGIVQGIAPIISSLDLPVVGPLGNVSIQSATDALGLGAVKVPLLGGLANVPLIGSVTVSTWLQTVSGIGALQSALPGLPQ